MSDPKQLHDIQLVNGESTIEAIHDLRIRVEALEGNLLPAQQRAHYVAPGSLPDGSGTERYSDGSGTARYADNWTQVSDGTDYPGSYGVGQQAPFVPFNEADDLAAGDSVRVIDANGVVKPEIHKVVSIGADSIAVDDGDKYPRSKVVRVLATSQPVIPHVPAQTIPAPPSPPVVSVVSPKV